MTRIGVHPFDRLLFRRTLVLSALFGLVALAVMVLSDEAESTAGRRVARLAALAPGLGTAAALLVIEQARTRAEIAGLVALGLPPWQACRGAMVAGWTVGAAAVLLFLTPWSDPASLFPRLPEPGSWQVEGDWFVNPSAQIALDVEGGIHGLGRQIPAQPEPDQRLWAVLGVGPLALVAPPWAVTPLSVTRRIAGFLLSLAATIVLLHLVAVRLLSATWLGLAALPLVLQLWHGRCRGLATARICGFGLRSGDRARTAGTGGKLTIARPGGGHDSPPVQAGGHAHPDELGNRPEEAGNSR